MTANAEIILEEHKAVLQIPEGSIIYDKTRKHRSKFQIPRARKGKKKVAVNIGYLQRRKNRTPGRPEGRRSGGTAIENKVSGQRSQVLGKPKSSAPDLRP